MDYIDTYRSTLDNQKEGGDTRDHIEARKKFYAGARVDVSRAIGRGELIPKDFNEYLDEMNRSYVKLSEEAKKDILSENPRYTAAELVKKYGFERTIVYRYRANHTSNTENS